jgi:hypothetical protein
MSTSQRPSGAEDPGYRIADALTAILLHAEAIRRRSAGMGGEETETVSSARHIAGNAQLAWNALEQTQRELIHRNPPA